MQGKISDFSIPDIFQLVSSQTKSGSLSITVGDRVTVFLFSDGMIVDVQPDRREPRSLLGTMLRDAGYLTDGELKRSLASQGSGGMRIGQMLVEKGKISREVLARYLLLQVKECLFDVLAHHEGEYKFEGFAVRPIPWAGNPIRPDVLMMEGMQFLDEYPRYRELFPSKKFRVYRKKGEKVDPYAFPEAERFLWKALDFSDDPDRIFRKACMTDFEGIKTLAGLKERGLVDISVAEGAGLDDSVRRQREEIAFLRRLDVVNLALWGGGAAVVAVGVYRAFFSPAASRTFTGWVNFF